MARAAAKKTKTKADGSASEVMDGHNGERPNTLPTHHSYSTTKADLIDQVATAANLKKKDAKAAVDAFLSKVEEALKAGNKVQLTGFGTFEVRSRKARTGVKPGTTQKIKIPASKYPAFKPGKALKETVKGSASEVMDG